MKEFHKYGIAAFSGTVADATFWAGKTKMGSIMRRWVMPKTTTQNTDLGLIAVNFSSIWKNVSALYKANGALYASRWNSENYDPQDPFFQDRGFYSFWVKMLYKFSELGEGHIDLKTVTKSDLDTLGGDILNIEDAILNGYLDSITVYDDLTSVM